MSDSNTALTNNAPSGEPEPERREEQEVEPEQEPPTPLFQRRFTQRIPGGRLEYTFSAGPIHNNFPFQPAERLLNLPPLPPRFQLNIQDQMPANNDSTNATEGNIINPESPVVRYSSSPGLNSMLQYFWGITRGPMEVMPWQSAEWERLVAESMANTGGVKRIASSEGLNEIKVLKYSKPANVLGSPTSPKEEMCAITQMAFEEGDLVAQMPCGHKFDKECLFRWLETESAACPVCRKEIQSREVSVSGETANSDNTPLAEDTPLAEEIATENEPSITPRIILRRNAVGDARAAERVALERLYEFERQREDDILEAAIVAAVMQRSIDET